MRRNIMWLLVIFLLVSCGRESVDINEEPIGIEKHVRAMPGKDVVDIKHGTELWFAIAAMDGVDAVPANGIVQSHFFEDGTSLINIQLNIELPSDEFFYEGWLDRGSLEPLSLGHLRSMMSDVRHQRIFESKEDLRTFTHVFVTREADDGDPTPGMRVAEGMLKERKR